MSISQILHDKFEAMMDLYVLKGNKVDVMIQDQTSDILDYFLCRQLFDLTLAAPVTLDAYTVTVVSGASVVNGTYVCIQEGKRAFQAKVLSGGGTNTLTLDTPVDYPFTVAASVANRTPALNVNGSVTPVVAYLKPLPGVKWDVTRIIGAMTHATAPNDGLFGGITALTKGIIIRKSNGVHHTIFNVKSNGELKERMYDVQYAAAPPTALEGTAFRRTFAGQDKNGVVIRLDGDLGDQLEIIIQDDLTGLASFRIVAQGHVVED